METLGSVIQQILRGQDEFLELVAEHNLALLSRIQTAAEAGGKQPRDYIAETVHSTLNSADEERWATLMSAMRNSQEPGYRFLEQLIAARLTAEGY